MYDELYHYGIKGMKWGVRRYENEDGSLTEAGKKRYARKEKRKERAKKIGKAVGLTTAAAAALYGGRKLYKKVRLPDDLREIKKQRLKDLRNRSKMPMEMLKNKIERLETEKRLKDLTNEEVASGRRTMKEILANVGKKTASTALSGATIYALKALISKKFDKKEFSNSVFNGGPKKK